MEAKITPKHPSILPDRDLYRKWYIDESFQVDVTFDDGKTLKITVPKGYRTDAHSIPFILRPIFPKLLGKDFYASVVHDLLIDVEPFLRVTRRQQDQVYESLMNNPLYKTSDFRTTWMTRAVKWYGWLKSLGDYRGEMKQETVLNLTLTTKDA